MKLHVLVACHNRRELTLQAVRGIGDSAKRYGALVDFAVFDDGSTDGTSRELRALDFAITILEGDGSAYWARSMAIAERYVLGQTRPRGQGVDYIVWLNDDVKLDPDAIQRIAPTLYAHQGAVIVGATRDEATHEITYSGFTRYGRHPLHYSKLAPGAVATEVETFNGNIVFVPLSVANALGGIDGEFSHAWADIDYGFRCGQNHVKMILAPGTYGSCSLNQSQVRPLWAEWRDFVSPKGAGNVHSLSRLLRRHGGVWWGGYFLGTYLLWWARQLRRVWQ